MPRAAKREVLEEGAAVDVEQMETPPRGPLMSEAQTHRRRLASSTLAPENWSGSSLVKKTVLLAGGGVDLRDLAAEQAGGEESAGASLSNATPSGNDIGLFNV
jgi:hypothetical protein